MATKTVRRPRVRLERITPAKAQAILDEANIDNRRIRPFRVADYVDQITRGQWHTTGQGITFDWNGNLVDGQHRLLAIVQTGVTLDVVVLRDADPAAYAVVDKGLPRQIADTLAAAGYQNAARVGTNAKVVIGWRNGWDPATARRRITSTDVLAFVRANYDRGLSDATALSDRLYRAVGGSMAAWAAIAFEAIAARRAEVLESFFEPIITGANLDVGDPRLTLRNYTVSRGGVGNRNIRVYPEVHVRTYTKALNAFLAGNPLLSLRTWNPRSENIRPSFTMTTRSARAA